VRILFDIFGAGCDGGDTCLGPARNAPCPLEKNPQLPVDRTELLKLASGFPDFAVHDVECEGFSVDNAKLTRKSATSSFNIEDLFLMIEDSFLVIEDLFLDVSS